MRAINGLAILMFLCLDVYSQPAKIKGGLKAGLSFVNTKITPGSYGSISNRTGLIAGGFLNIHVNKNLLVQPAAIFVRKGGRNYATISAGYLEIPLCILYKTGSEKGSYFMGGGLSPAFRISSDFYGYHEKLKKFDLGISALAGYMFPIGFSINLGYTHGILDVSNNDDYSLHNRYFSITAGYEF